LSYLEENEADDLWLNDLEDYIKISKKNNLTKAKGLIGKFI
jgi:hypothetical protein